MESAAILLVLKIKQQFSVIPHKHNRYSTLFFCVYVNGGVEKYQFEIMQTLI